MLKQFQYKRDSIGIEMTMDQQAIGLLRSSKSLGINLKRSKKSRKNLQRKQFKENSHLKKIHKLEANFKFLFSKSWNHSIESILYKTLNVANISTKVLVHFQSFYVKWCQMTIFSSFSPLRFIQRYHNSNSH